jgi:uncharacterized protein
MRNKLFFLTSILLISSLLTGCASAAYAQSSTPAATAAASAQAQEPKQIYRTITVTGSGLVYLTPDIAYVNLGVHSEGANAADTVAANNTLSAKIISALKTFGIAEKDIQTVNFSISPQQQYDTNGKPTGEILYMVDNTVYVTVRDLSKIGDLLDAAVKAGANNVYGIQFDVADKTKAVSDARKAAMANARAIAEELATAAGVMLGDVQTINVYDTSAPMVAQAKMAGASFAADSVSIQPGQMTITVQVNVVYEIR